MYTYIHTHTYIYIYVCMYIIQYRCMQYTNIHKHKIHTHEHAFSLTRAHTHTLTPHSRTRACTHTDGHTHTSEQTSEKVHSSSRAQRVFLASVLVWHDGTSIHDPPTWLHACVPCISSRVCMCCMHKFWHVCGFERSCVYVFCVSVHLSLCVCMSVRIDAGMYIYGCTDEHTYQQSPTQRKIVIEPRHYFPTVRT